MKSKEDFLALGAAVFGGILGYFAFFWCVHQGLYSLVLPGGLAGLCAGVVKNKSWMVAVLCGLLGLGFGVFAEWRMAPFTADPSLGYFVMHLHDRRPITLLMIAVGALIGFWVPFRRRQPTTAA